MIEKTAKRFVAYFDILGFKELVARNSHEHVYELLLSLSNLRDKVERITEAGDNENAPIIVNFSDSFFIFSPDDTVESFRIFSSMTAFFFANSIERMIPLKGAIAYGNITLNYSKKIYFGQPIIDAYLLEEDLNYLGLVAHHSVENYIMENDIKINRFVEVCTPFKFGKVDHLNLNWVYKLKQFKFRKDSFTYVDEVISKLKVSCSGSPRKYLDNTLQVFKLIDAKGKLNPLKIKS